MIGRLAELEPERRRARDRPGPRRPHGATSPTASAPSTPSSSTARSSRPARARSTAARNVDLVFGDALRLDLAALDPAPTKLVSNLPVQRRDAARRREPRRAADARALVRDGAARGRRPLLRRAGDEGVRRRLRARPARGRAHGLPPRLAHGVPPAAERRLGARRVPAPRASGATSREREALVDGGVRAPPQDAPELARARRPRGRERRRPPRSTRSAATGSVRAEELEPPEFVALAEALAMSRAPATAKINLALVVGPLRDGRPARGRHGAAADRPRRPRRRSSRAERSRSTGSPTTRSCRAALEAARRGGGVEPRWQARIWKRDPGRGGPRRRQLRRGDGAPARERAARRAASRRSGSHALAGEPRRRRPVLPHGRARSSARGDGHRARPARPAAGLLGRAAPAARARGRARPPRSTPTSTTATAPPASSERRARARRRARAVAASARPRRAPAERPRRRRRTRSELLRARRLPRRRQRRRADRLRALPAPRARAVAARARAAAARARPGSRFPLGTVDRDGATTSLSAARQPSSTARRRLGRWLRARRIRHRALDRGRSKAIIVALAHDVSRWTVIALAIPLLALYVFWGRHARLATPCGRSPGSPAPRRRSRWSS